MPLKQRAYWTIGHGLPVPVSLVKAARMLGRVGGARHRIDIAMGEDAPLVQHHHVIAGIDLVDEMGRPQHTQAILAAQAMHVIENGLPGADIDADRRFVQQQEARPVQQRAGDLDPPHLAAAQAADLVLEALEQAGAAELGLDALRRVASAHAVQRRVIAQVVGDRQIEVERALLEDGADHARAPRRAARAPRIRRRGSSRRGCCRAA